jgi:3-hydroxyisobutyrate dehydrogenase
MNQSVAFLGLGAMGAPMAGNLLEAGFELQVWNRTASRCAPLVAQGARAFDQIAQTIGQTDCVVSMLADDRATAEVMLAPNGVIAQAQPRTLVIDCSTNSPSMAREVAAAARARNIFYLDAPVSGSIGQARARELVFMVGGESDHVQAAEPLFRAMGRLTRHMGPSGAGATIKLINNMLSGTMNAALAEACAVALAAGLDPQAAIDVLGEGAAASRLTRTKLPKMFAGEFEPQFQLRLMDKDLQYFLTLAQQLDQPVALASLVRSQMQAACLAGLGGRDVSAVFAHIRPGVYR